MSCDSFDNFSRCLHNTIENCEKQARNEFFNLRDLIYHIDNHTKLKCVLLEIPKKYRKVHNALTIIRSHTNGCETKGIKSSSTTYDKYFSLALEKFNALIIKTKHVTKAH